MTNQISPYIQDIITKNHIKVLSVLRYGPRFACLSVEHQGRQGFLKIALPLEEQRKFRPEDYYWTDHDSLEELELRLMREATVLQYLSQVTGNAFEPQLIALNSVSPVWSLRSYIYEDSMALVDSNFAFDPRFFSEVSPDQVMNLITTLHSITPQLPEAVRNVAAPAESRLESRLGHVQAGLAYIRTQPHLAPYADSVAEFFDQAPTVYRPEDFVLTHGEPYAPHFFLRNNRLGLIDWENAGFDDSLVDLSIVFFRCFQQPKWRDDYLSLIDGAGYFDGTGRTRWKIALVMQACLNHRYLSRGGKFLDAEFDRQALDYCEFVIKNSSDL